MPPVRLCLEADCNRLTYGSRCEEHEAARQKMRWADKAIARRVVKASPICACRGCNLHRGPCNATDDLTADHVKPLARGGTNEGKRQTLCRRCNSSKQASYPRWS